jgi:hypothetical protein
MCSAERVALLVIACELSNSLRSPFFSLVSGSPLKCSCVHIDSQIWCCATCSLSNLRAIPPSPRRRRTFYRPE